MKILISLSSIALLTSASALAAPVPITPGLWEVTMKVNAGGKDIDPQAELKKAMEKMTPEQRKQVEMMIASSGAAFDEEGLKICYAKEQLADAKVLGHDPRQSCTSKLTSQTKDKIAMTFKCEDGSTGKGEWNISKPTAYTGHMDFVRQNGKKTRIDQVARFVNAECGTVKPFAAPAGK